MIDSARTTGNGIYIFNTEGGGNMILHTNSQPAFAWRMITLAGGDYIEAQHTATVYENVLNTMDSVKVFVLQGKNAQGNNFNHPINGREIRLSRSHGLTQFFLTDAFPLNTTSLTLAGRAGITGEKNITAADIFSYDTGDEFQYEGGYSMGINGYHKRWIRKRVIAKSVSANQDTLTYRFARLEYHRTETGSPPDSTVLLLNDTITEKIVLSENEHLNMLTLEPFISTPGGTGFG